MPSSSFGRELLYNIECTIFIGTLITCAVLIVWGWYWLANKIADWLGVERDDN